jgi:hypothetical protein
MDLIEGITERDVERFTEGDCHVLAKRLHRVAGLPLHTFIYGDEIDLHAFVMVGNKALDVMGLWDIQDFINEWSIGTTPTKISPPMSIDFFNLNWEGGRPQLTRYSYKRAREVADILLNKYVH